MTVRLWIGGDRLDDLDLGEAIARAVPGSTLEVDLASRLRNAEALRALSELDPGITLKLRDMDHFGTGFIGRAQLAALASGVQRWSDALSDATREGLVRAQQEGVTLGGDRGYVIRPEDARKGREAWAERQRRRREELGPRIRALREDGWTLQRIADTLNAEGVRTLSGRGAWNPSTVRRIL